MNKTAAAILLTVLFMLAPSAATNTYARQSPFTVRGVAVAEGSGRGAVPVEGSVPEVSGLSNSTFQSGLNDSIRRFYIDKRDRAEANGQFALAFDYDVKTDGGTVASLIVYTTSETPSETNAEADSFNFDYAECRMLTLTDILGENAAALAGKAVLRTMQAEPDVYTGEFDGVTPETGFYLEDGQCVLLFDKNEIAAGFVGIVELPITLESVKNYRVSKSGYFVLEDYYNLKMLPLRSICEGLGFTVGWDKSTGSVTVTKGTFRTRVTPLENMYSTGRGGPRELESPPIVRGGVTYVPISFFETILGAVYSIDDTEAITFSHYPY